MCIVNVTVFAIALHVSVFYIASQKGCKPSILLAMFKCFIPESGLIMWPLMSKVV